MAKAVRIVRRSELNRRKTIPFNFGPEHKEYIRKCRYNTYNILEGAVRSGKTIDNIFAFAYELKKTPDKIHLASGSTLANAKMNIGDSNGFGLEWIFRGQCRWGKYKGMEALIIQGPFTNFRQRIIIFAGSFKSDSFKAIRGNSYGMWIATEINLHHDNFIKEAFNRQLAASNRKIFWDLNPDNPRAPIYTDYLDVYARKAATGELLGGYNYQHLNIFQNVNITPERLEEIVSQYEKGSLWYIRDILGERTVAEGLIYSMFNPETHIVSGSQKREYGKYYISCDYGTINPTSMGLWGCEKGIWYRIREYYFDSRKEKRQRTDEEHYTALKELAGDILPEQVVVDPSAASFIECIRRHGRFRVAPASNRVIDGIRDVATRLRNGTIKICDTCPDCIREFGLYRWDDKATEDRPIKEDDHAMDDVRYFVRAAFSPQLFSFD
jgi:PBSX family phage terminase large subunit